MNYIKKFGLFASVIALSLVFMAISASAQVRIGVQLGHNYYRPRVVERYYGPPVYYGPSYWGHSERYYDRKALNTARNRLEKDEYKFRSDGYVSPKEERKLDSDFYKLHRDQRRLHSDW